MAGMIASSRKRMGEASSLMARLRLERPEMVSMQSENSIYPTYGFASQEQADEWNRKYQAARSSYLQAAADNKKYSGMSVNQGYIEQARTLRSQMKSVLKDMETTHNRREYDKLSEKLSDLRSQFSDTMSIIDALRNQGNPMQFTALENLTSLASRGGWMGENNNTNEYFSRLDRQIDLLQQIDEDVQKGEKSVWN